MYVYFCAYTIYDRYMYTISLLMYILNYTLLYYTIHIYKVYMAALPPNSSRESSSSQRLFDSCLEEVKRLQEQIEV